MKELNQFYQKDTTSEKSFYDDFESGCQMSANNKNRAPWNTAKK